MGEKTKKLATHIHRRVCTTRDLFGPLLLFPQKFSGGRINRNLQLSVIPAVPIVNVPHQFVFVLVPVDQINDVDVRILLQDFVTTMLLRHFEGLVRIDLEESHIKDLSGSVVGTVSVFRPERDPPARSIGSVGS